jgi:thymidylate synthase
MADSHIYENQVEGVKKQLKQWDNARIIEILHPKLVFKDDAPTNFWDITVDDFEIIDYEPMPAIKYEVAV